MSRARLSSSKRSGRVWGVLVLIAMTVGLQGEAAEKKLTGLEIARRCFNRRGYKEDESTALRMRLVNASGKTRKMEFVRYQKKVKGSKKTLMKFSWPKDIKDMGTLNEEVSGADDLQHLYLPAMKKMRRISVKKKAWMGSDINFEDIQEWEFDNFTYKAMGEGPFDGRPCYIYERTPKKSEYSVYSKQIEWVMKDGFRPVKTLYYDKQGKKLKTMEYTDLRDTDQPGLIYAWRITMTNLQDGHKTDIIRQWLYLDSGLDDKLVSTRHLRKSVDFYNHPIDMKKIWAAARVKEKF